MSHSRVSWPFKNSTLYPTLCHKQCSGGYRATIGSLSSSRTPRQDSWLMIDRAALKGSNLWTFTRGFACVPVSRLSWRRASTQTAQRWCVSHSTAAEPRDQSRATSPTDAPNYLCCFDIINIFLGELIRTEGKHIIPCAFGCRKTGTGQGLVYIWVGNWNPST